MRWLLLLSAIAVAGGCGGDEPLPKRDAAPQRLVQDRVVATTPARCAVGERPRYYVPSDPPLALVGCARLGTGGRRVEFSASMSRIGRERHSCIDPAYGRGAYIPGMCAFQTPLTSFAIRDAAQPSQGVRGYGFVIWGTAGDADRVVARFDGGRAPAAILDVPAELARRFGEPPFRLFVTELPPRAACHWIDVARGNAVERVRSAYWGCSTPTGCRTRRPGFRPPGHVTNRPARRLCPS
jgi:hypothetical protein